MLHIQPGMRHFVGCIHDHVNIIDAKREGDRRQNRSEVHGIIAACVPFNNHISSKPFGKDIGIVATKAGKSVVSRTACDPVVVLVAG